MNSATWNQSFTFSNLQLTEQELEQQEILLECFDLNEFATNTLIGSHSIGLASLYRNNNHEYYYQWLHLLHPLEREPQGYLLVSCYIISSDDEPPVHGINEI